MQYEGLINNFIMARKIKQGLDYFPFDVTFFNDIKIRKLIKYQGGAAISVYTSLLCNIYEESGYYILWDKELPFIVSETTGLKEAFINEVIECCLKVGLFNNDLYEKEKVLTSKGIQERYDLICRQAKRKSQIKNFNLISLEETEINSEEINNISEVNNINSGKSTQSKVKESKVKESKVNGEEKFPPITTQEILLSRQISIEQWAMKNKVSVQRIQECITEFSEFKSRTFENMKWSNESDLIKNFEFWLNSNAKPKPDKTNSKTPTNGNPQRNLYRG